MKPSSHSWITKANIQQRILVENVLLHKILQTNVYQKKILRVCKVQKMAAAPLDASDLFLFQNEMRGY